MKKRIVVGLAGLCAALLFSWSANASHIDVNSTEDVMDNKDGKCTLREAIKVANYGVTFGKAVGECVKTGLGLLERISLPAGTYILTEGTDGSKENYEVPSSIDEEDDGIIGDLDIKYSYDIVGEGSKSTIIKATEYGSRVFDIIKGNVKISISGVTIKNGYSFKGGGISNSGALTLKDCVIAENSSVTSGGGIFNSGDGSLIISDCKVTENSADYGGGGIDNLGSMEITNSTISNNSAKDDGGGIQNQKTLVVSDSTISNNTAKGVGGGIVNVGNTTITNSMFSGNKAGGSGAIANWNDSNLEIKNSTFTKNLADKEGNVINNSNGGFVSMIHDTIYKNIGGYGTALVNAAPADNFILQNTIILANAATTECEGEFKSNGGNFFGNVPNCGLELQPTDKTYQNYMTMPMGDLKDLGKPGMAYYPLMTGNVALGAAVSDECEKEDQIHHTRKQKCDTGAIEATCGDGIKHSPEEECDDGDNKDNNACTNSCKSAKCGDGVVYAKNEACDDGNTIDTDGCRNNCGKAKCGDGIVWAGVEECDDGNKINNDTCFDTCKKAPTTLKTMPSKIKKIIKLPK